jgi:hypothetical protein
MTTTNNIMLRYGRMHFNDDTLTVDQILDRLEACRDETRRITVSLINTIASDDLRETLHQALRAIDIATERGDEGGSASLVFEVTESLTELEAAGLIDRQAAHAGRKAY